MKTIITALVAMAFNFNASASHLHTAECSAKCPEFVMAVAPVAKSYEQKLAELKLIGEDKASMLRYQKTMQGLFTRLKREKHENAIENLEAENAYNNLMVQVLNTIEEEKLADRLADLEAIQRYEQLMGRLLKDTTRI